MRTAVRDCVKYYNQSSERPPISWPPIIHTSAMKIVPLVVLHVVYSAGFVKCFDITVFCFILNQSGQLWIKKKITTAYCFKFIL